MPRSQRRAARRARTGPKIQASDHALLSDAHRTVHHAGQSGPAARALPSTHHHRLPISVFLVVPVLWLRRVRVWDGLFRILQPPLRHLRRLEQDRKQRMDIHRSREQHEKRNHHATIQQSGPSSLDHRRLGSCGERTLDTSSKHSCVTPLLLDRTGRRTGAHVLTSSTIRRGASSSQSSGFFASGSGILFCIHQQDVSSGKRSLSRSPRSYPGRQGHSRRETDRALDKPRVAGQWPCGIKCRRETYEGSQPYAALRLAYTCHE